MLKFGTTAAFGFEDFPQPGVVSLYTGAGCELIQVYRNRTKNIPAADILARLTGVPARVDSLHGHFGDDLDPSAEDESVRRATVDLYRGEADYCRQLGGDLVVVHPCPGKVAVGSLDEKYRQLWRSFEELARVGERSGVRFAFENMPPYHPLGNDAARLANEVGRFGSPHIVFLLDFGHAHMCGDVVEAIRAAGPRLKYTHVHDNDGTRDIHWLPGKGSIAWERCADALREIGYDGVFLLEVFESPAELSQLLTPDWKTRMRGILA